ncbi:MAG: YciC family protein [Dongiaceae bacterium]
MLPGPHEKIVYTGESLRFAWQKTKENLGFLIVFWLLYLALMAFASWALEIIFPGEGGNETIRQILNWVTTIFLGMGVTKIHLDIVDGKKPSLNDILATLPYFINFLITSTLYTLITIAGFILLIIPGVIWFYKYLLSPYFVIDKNMDPIAALKASAKATRGEKFNLFILTSTFPLIIFLGVLALGIGILVAMPVVYLAQAYVYRRLEERMIEPLTFPTAHAQ